MRPPLDIECAMERHANTVWRVCVLNLSSSADAQDAFQETFLKYALAEGTVFNGEQHEKAWLIRVATNVCRDMRKAAASRNVALDDRADHLASVDPVVQPGSFSSEVVDALRSLDDPPRTPLFLSLCEGYSAPEIANLMGASVNTVYSWLRRGKKSLKEALS